MWQLKTIAWYIYPLHKIFETKSSVSTEFLPHFSIFLGSYICTVPGIVSGKFNCMEVNFMDICALILSKYGSLIITIMKAEISKHKVCKVLFQNFLRCLQTSEMHPKRFKSTASTYQPLFLLPSLYRLLQSFSHIRSSYAESYRFLIDIVTQHRIFLSQG